ncbi:MAG: hypothetical protein ACPKQO_04140 [Nitrososphaeraceae archaeon]
MSTSYVEIKKKLQRKWITYLQKQTKITLKPTICGTSPPSVFVGSFGYPKVNVGPLLPPLHGDTMIYDTPEMWENKDIEDILDYRLSMIHGITKLNINNTTGRYIESLQELAIASQSTDGELTLEKNPRFSLSKDSMNRETIPSGPSSLLKSFKISSIQTDRKLEYYYYDKDLDSTNSIIELYRKKVDISKIHRAMSLGMLGIKKNRKLVPTKWSISATDDIISSYLKKQIEMYPTIDSFQVIKYSHYSNHYSIILIPDDVWYFEMIEAWFDMNHKRFILESDFENVRRIDHYPKIAGAYFAAKLGVTEHLFKIKRRASVIIFREIKPTYEIPLGVWQIREGIRKLFKKGIVLSFENFEDALNNACSDFVVQKYYWLEKSSVYKNIRRQTRISNFF